MTQTNLTQLLQQLKPDDTVGLDRLFSGVYDELRGMAQAQLRKERRNHTLRSTDLVNESFLKLRLDLAAVDWEWTDRKQFFFLAARAMRQILVDYARHRTRQKRGGGAPHLPLDDVAQDELLREASLLFPEVSDAERELQVAEALVALRPEDPEACAMFEMHYYTDLSHATIAEFYGVSTRTVRRRLRYLEARIKHHLAPP